MHKIIQATYDFIDVLEQSDIVKQLVVYKEKVKNNLELSKLLEEGRSCQDNYLLLDIRRKLYQNADYQNYVHYYNELFYIVMNINRRYQKLLNHRACRKG